MNQRYPLPVALRRASQWGRLMGLLILPALVARPGQAQTPYALANGNYFEDFAGIGTWTAGFASGTGAAQATTYMSATPPQVTPAAADVATRGNYPLAVAHGFKISNTVSFAVTGAYYTKTTGSRNELSTHGANPNGSGPAPISFGAPAQVRHVNDAGSQLSVGANMRSGAFSLGTRLGNCRRFVKL